MQFRRFSQFWGPARVIKCGRERSLLNLGTYVGARALCPTNRDYESKLHYYRVGRCDGSPRIRIRWNPSPCHRGVLSSKQSSRSDHHHNRYLFGTRYWKLATCNRGLFGDWIHRCRRNAGCVSPLTPPLSPITGRGRVLFGRGNPGRRPGSGAVLPWAIIVLPLRGGSL